MALIGDTMPEFMLGASRIDGPDPTRRVLIVGEVNPYGQDPSYALYHLPERAAGHRLQSVIMGVEARRWYLPMWRTNLCTTSWEKGDAIERVKVLLGADAPWTTVVMLGVKVAKAFAFHTGQDAKAFQDYASFRPPGPSSGPAIRFVALPHPSGRNASSWAGTAVEDARNLLRVVAPEIPWGSS